MPLTATNSIAVSRGRPSRPASPRSPSRRSRAESVRCSFRPISGSALFDVAADRTADRVRACGQPVRAAGRARRSTSIGLPTSHGTHDRVSTRSGPGCRRSRRRSRRCDRRPRSRPAAASPVGAADDGQEIGLPITSTSQNATTVKMRLKTGPGRRDRHALAHRLAVVGLIELRRDATSPSRSSSIFT